MRHILTGQYHPPVFRADPSDSGGGEGEASLSTMSGSPSIGHPDTTERVEGEISPNFSKLTGTKTIASPKTEDPPPKKEEPSRETKVEEPKKEEKKAAEPKTKAKEEAKPAKDEPRKAASEPEAKKGDKTAEKPAVKPGEATKEEPKVEEKTEKQTIPEKDDDIDSIRPNPDAPAAVIKSINDMKAIVKSTREAARDAARQLEATRTELEAAKAQSGKLPPEVEARVKRADDILLTFEAENNEGFRAEYDTKIVKAEENLFTMLKGHGLGDAQIEELKKVGVDRWDKWNEWTDPEGKKHPGVFDILKGLPAHKLALAIDAREQAINAKSTKLQELATNRQQAMEEFSRKEHASRVDWANKVESASNKLFAGEDWILEEPVPADATTEEKAAIEKSNAAKRDLAQQWVKYSNGAYQRDPEMTSEIVVKAMKTDHLIEVLAEKETALERAEARILELETRIGKARAAGRMAHTETADTTPVEEKKPVEIGGDGQDAIRNYKWGSGKK